MAPAMTMSPRPPLPRLAVWAWSTALLLGVAGCTICPDPFDYSGPVPNGSAPQNDFRARSNGIAPTGGVPRPWPPVVQVEPERADEVHVATPAVETETVETETVETETVETETVETETVETGAAEIERVEADDIDPTTASDGLVVPTAAETSDEQVEPATAEAPVAETLVVDDILPPAEPARPEHRAGSSETPGWRPRD